MSLPKSDCTAREIQLLVDLAANAPGAGGICDVGCGSGGSTIAFAMGLQAAGRPGQKQIKAFDLFEEADDPHATLARFRERTAAFDAWIEVFPGDITTVEIPEDPIDILFIDIAKTAAAHQASIGRFFGRLCEDAIVLNQDFGRPNLPWIHHAFVFLSGHASAVEIVDDTIRLDGLGRIPDHVVRKVASDDFTGDERVGLIRQGIERFGDIPARGGVAYRDILTLGLFFLNPRADDAKQHLQDFLGNVPNPPENLVKVVEIARKMAA